MHKVFNSFNMNTDEYRWHFDYVRLAYDSGFSFHSQRLKSTLGHSISHLDIEQLIRDRDVATIERYIDAVLEFKLEGEQAKFLDQTLIKLFHISQLVIQYLLFCKRYLDNTVVLIKSDVNNNNEELKNLKRHTEELKLENSNLKRQVKDLKSALNCQVASTQNVAVFQCNECPKAFSTEEYLLAHVKRRHERNPVSEVSKTSLQVETDKLQLEIKELKERLNNTEKLIHSDESGCITKSTYNENNQKVAVENVALTELQHKFELLKLHVENELCILQTQKFDQEKYEKWFETFLSQLGNSNNNKQLAVISNNSDESRTDSKVHVCSACKELNHERNIFISKEVNTIDIEKSNFACQTDFVSSDEHDDDKTVYSKPLISKPRKLSLSNNNKSSENIQEKIMVETNDRLIKFEEVIEEKVTGSIEKIESQMQSFVTKINEIEKQALKSQQTKTNQMQNRVQQLELTPSFETTSIKAKRPVPKPRKKIASNKTSLKQTKSIKDSKPSTSKKKVIKTTEVLYPRHSIIKIKEPYDRYSSSESDSESEISNSNLSDNFVFLENENSHVVSKVNDMNVQPSNSGKYSTTKPTGYSPEILQNDIEVILNGRLEELGVSPEWSTLPYRSYQRALSILNQQTNSIQKNISNYMQIKSRLFKEVDRKTLEKENHSKKSSKFKEVMKNVTNKVKLKENKEVKPVRKIAIVNFSKKSDVKQSNDSVETIMGNRKNSMYLTDSESESLNKNKSISLPKKENIYATNNSYSKVISQLNANISSKKWESNSDSEINERNSQTLKQEEVIIEAAALSKGVLKSFPSVGSLQNKKKVLFDLELSDMSNIKKIEQKTDITKAADSGSTTSIASSILDAPKQEEDSMKKLEKTSIQQLLSDLSDWEMSDTGH